MPINDPKMSPPNIRCPGRYGVANSAGPIGGFRAEFGADPDSSGYAFRRRKDAKSCADSESGAGWLGDCWVVRYTGEPVPEPRRVPAHMIAPKWLADDTPGRYKAPT